MPTSKLSAIEKRLRTQALAYPGAVEEFPWGERVIKVRGKIFVFINLVEGCLRVTTKLPESNGVALMLPFATATGYGLGKSGWVSARFERNDDAPEAMLAEWIDESYRAIAPKKLIAELDGASAPAPAPPKKKPATKKGAGPKTSSKKKPAPKKRPTQASPG